ncbi:MAG TPA: cupin domain-containing protein [Intrasporangium sp.]|uniref:cupin domain-containing protein n=1 Tax=Intrasporangium sp. TaxID=1925024 RepID=UPI002D77217D|nr:cupin domain-containing protein [Intrasporangium sp.]HET7398611.1 cupin domain-containing protein [Intrasporangium sp.]
MRALELLSGDAQTFLDSVWASRVHIHRADPQSLVGLLSLDDVDHLLTSVALRTPALRVVQDGVVLAASRFTRSGSIGGSPLTGLVDPRRVMELFDGGATLVLQGLHRYWPPLTDLVRSLELELGHPCQANAYLTPPQSQGFARHADSHDVFVFQTHGRKSWTVGQGDQDQDLDLVPGLCAYLPTGTPHSARSETEPSLHVTVGINRLTWRQLLRRISDEVLAGDRYDRPVPAGYLTDPGRLAAPLAGELAAFAAALGRLDAEVVARDGVAAFLSDRTPALRGGLTDRVALSCLQDSTGLARRPGVACVLLIDDERLRVLLGDRELRMPPRLSEAMTFVRDHQRFRVGDLSAWLDGASRLVLARRLVREGLLRIEP